MLSDVPKPFASMKESGASFLIDAAYAMLSLEGGRHAASSSRIFEALGELFPDHALPLIGQAECRLQLGQHAQAAALAKKAVTCGRHSRDTMALTLWFEARGYLGMESMPDAIRALREARAFDRDGAIGRRAAHHIAALERVAEQTSDRVPNPPPRKQGAP